MQSVRPSKGRVLARKTERETKLNGFFLSDNEAYHPDTAVIIETATTEYNVGDTVIYKTYAVQDIKLNGQDHFIINEEDILGVVYENNI